MRNIIDFKLKRFNKDMKKQKQTAETSTNTQIIFQALGQIHNSLLALHFRLQAVELNLGFITQEDIEKEKTQLNPQQETNVEVIKENL